MLCLVKNNEQTYTLKGHSKRKTVMLHNTSVFVRNNSNSIVFLKRDSNLKGKVHSIVFHSMISVLKVWDATIGSVNWRILGGVVRDLIHIVRGVPVPPCQLCHLPFSSYNITPKMPFVMLLYQWKLKNAQRTKGLSFRPWVFSTGSYRNRKSRLSWESRSNHEESNHTKTWEVCVGGGE